LSESNGNPNIAIGDLNVDLQGISFDGALGVFDSILGGLISGIVNRFEDRIGNEIKSAVNDVLAEQFTQLIPENTRIVINDRELALDLDLAAIYTNNDSLFIGLSGGVLPLTPNSLIPDPLGPVYTSDTLPEPILGGDLGIAVNSNVINQTLVAAYASGITHLTLLGEQVLFDIPRDDNLGEVGQSRILVNPGAAPYISLQETNGESSTTLTIRNLEVISENRSEEGWQNEFNVALDASIEINVGVNADSTLKINFVSDPIIDVKRTIIGSGLTIPSDLIDDILRNEIPGILEQISQSLSGIKLPSVGGYVLTADDFYALGDNASHAGLTGSLSKAP
ncbi:MAG: hypothetical protein MI867_05595, partial [Pseudomonadales bacterium]|nr:hypothetical protein [Pseudomonadales bacterium]